ncbi:hypothetical protein QBA57_28685 [Streptomyces scabiei]|uniref:hypothetical protein n=1 Tax=Streptomyces scabiei TaxID=1930 RepID=UPI001B324438|nr:MULTISPECIES: hypothetical protein [Streptomyces]MBP5883155.1 hypothetical protein [Streptomyces sp. LBUM 1487]MDX2628603.1 hypothetical protein [Streptomyces scabiei]MDX3162731.1 hypothetical protein [Streptomyces scabiei]
MATTAEHLTLVIHHWRDLREALGGRSAPAWPPAGRMTDYLRALDDVDAEQLEAERHRALALRTLERDPGQIGERPIPIRLPIHETMRIVRAALVECADQIAASVQRPVMGLLPDGYPKADRARRELLVMQDRRDPRRWSWTSARPDAPYAALWLLGRVQGASGPFRPLTAPQLDHIATIARGCTRRIEDALDVGERRATLARPCPDCGGRLQLHGGAGAAPVARCTACGHVWGGQDAAAVA